MPKSELQGGEFPVSECAAGAKKCVFQGEIMRFSVSERAAGAKKIGVFKAEY